MPENKEFSIDWNQLWQIALERSSFRKRHPDRIAFWNGKAGAYSLLEKKDGEKRSDRILQLLKIKENDTVLDIGSGPGTLTIPLSRRAKKVTAVDPSARMLFYLNEECRKNGQKNIQCINRKWQDLAPGPDMEQHDFVVASYALAMPDLAEALLKMDQTAIKGIYLYWYSDNTPKSIYARLWPVLFGGHCYIHFPSYIYVLNILYQLGIYANVQIVDHISRVRFADLNDAVQYWQKNLKLASSRQLNILEKYLDEKLIRENGGSYLVRESRMAEIWWYK